MGGQSLGDFPRKSQGQAKNKEGDVVEDTALEKLRNLAIHMCYADARSCKSFGTSAKMSIINILTEGLHHFTPDRLTATKAFKDQQNRMPRALKSHLRLEAGSKTEDVKDASPSWTFDTYQPNHPPHVNPQA